MLDWRSRLINYEFGIYCSGLPVQISGRDIMMSQNKLAWTHFYFPAHTCSTTPLLWVLTLWHHVHVERLGGVVLILVVAVTEDAVEYALVGSRVIEGHVEDVDGAVLQVPGVLAAVPVQAVVETWVNDLSYLIFIAV